jgi:outer membrane protein assembly factor BamD (BamD/ComL family)
LERTEVSSVEERPEQSGVSVSRGASSTRSNQAATAPQDNTLEAKDPTAALVEESAILSRARRALRSGAAGEAWQLLQEAKKSHPKSVLVQERRLLEIETLSAMGRRAAAQRAARSFVAAFPTSPHRARAERFITDISP